MFARALASWGKLLGFGSKPDAVEEDRRSWGRTPCERETMCQPASGPADVWHPVRVRNVSQGGIGMEAGRAFTPGMLLCIALPETAGEEAAQVLACVVRCASMPEGRFSVGCTFAAVLSDADLSRFGAKQEKAEGDDQRHWVRFPSAATARLTVVRGSRREEVKAGRLRDVSAGGLALEVDALLQVGDLLQVELARDDETVFTTLASVVRAGTEPGGQHVIGCNFIGELPEEKLSRLLGE